MNLLVIPARGGSKRIPGKNSKPFLGIPVIQRVIKTAIESRCFDRLIVSTDDPLIAELAVQAGAEVPFLRPAHIADDFTGTLEVIRHAVTEMVQTADEDNVCCLYPTSVFVNAAILQKGQQLVNQNPGSYIMGSVSYDHPVQRSFTLAPDGRLGNLNEASIGRRTQDLEKHYHDAGQFYWGKAASWKQGQPIITDKSIAINFNGNEVHDIDTPEDWDIAELIFERSKSSRFR